MIRSIWIKRSPRGWGVSTTVYDKDMIKERKNNAPTLQNMSTIKQFLTVNIYLKQQTGVQQMLIALCISSVISTPLKVVYFCLQ